MVAAANLPRHLDRADDLERLAVDDLDVVAVAHVEERLVGPGREGKVARERRVGLDQLLQELPLAREHLHAAVLAIRDVHRAVVGYAYGMHDAELTWALAGDRLL